MSSQQPPTHDDGDLRRVDLVVEQIDSNANSITLLFMEAKRAPVSADQLKEVEYQAFTACCANLFATRNRGIWAMRCVGSRARVWAYRYDGNYLIPYFPTGPGLSEPAEYLGVFGPCSRYTRRTRLHQASPHPS